LVGDALRWMQEIRRLKPSTVSRRMSIVAAATARPSSTAYSSTPQPSTSADPEFRPSHYDRARNHLDRHPNYCYASSTRVSRTVARTVAELLSTRISLI
jgi:hypothetical protein